LPPNQQRQSKNSNKDARRHFIASFLFFYYYFEQMIGANRFCLSACVRTGSGSGRGQLADGGDVIERHGVVQLTNQTSLILPRSA